MWTRTCDRLPDTQKVIAHYYSINLHSWVVDTVIFQVFDGKFYSRNRRIIRNVTHWMPLPAPPTAEQAEGANLQHTTGQSAPLEAA